MNTKTKRFGCWARYRCVSFERWAEVIVPHDLDLDIGVIAGVEELHALPAAVLGADHAQHFSGREVDPRQGGRPGSRAARLRRPIRRPRGAGWDPRLLIVGPAHGGPAIVRIQIQGDLRVDGEHLDHLLVERGIAPFQVVLHPVRMEVMRREDLGAGALDHLGRTGVTGGDGVFADRPGQERRRPERRRPAEGGRLLADNTSPS